MADDVKKDLVLTPLKNPTGAAVAEGGTAAVVVTSAVGLVNALHPGAIPPDATVQLITLVPLVIAIFKFFRKLFENRQTSTQPVKQSDVNAAVAERKVEG